MKIFFLDIIIFYKKYISVVVVAVFGRQNSCRYEETCSSFAYRKINEDGVVKGVSEAFRRIAHCQPFI